MQRYHLLQSIMMDWFLFLGGGSETFHWLTQTDMRHINFLI